MVALVTPMQVDGSVDYQSLAKLVEFHIENNTSAIVSMGTTGESATLNMEEHCEVMSRTVEMVNGRIPVIAGTGANSTWEAIELTKGAKQGGADACLLVTPYYNKPPQQGLYEHHKKIAETVDIPPAKNIIPAVGGAVLTFSGNPVQAKAFLDYLISARGRKVMKDNGYTVDRPE